MYINISYATLLSRHIDWLRGGDEPTWQPIALDTDGLQLGRVFWIPALLLLFLWRSPSKVPNWRRSKRDAEALARLPTDEFALKGTALSSAHHRACSGRTASSSSRRSSKYRDNRYKEHLFALSTVRLRASIMLAVLLGLCGCFTNFIRQSTPVPLLINNYIRATSGSYLRLTTTRRASSGTERARNRGGSSGKNNGIK